MSEDIHEAPSPRGLGGTLGGSRQSARDVLDAEIKRAEHRLAGLQLLRQYIDWRAIDTLPADVEARLWHVMVGLVERRP